MALGDLSGRARVDVRNPSAQGVCDRCGFRFQLDALQFQFEWAGATLFNTQYLVCKKCLDRPNEQNRVLILPPDPVPRQNPRQDNQVTPPYPAVSPGNQGFTQYVLGVPTQGNYPTVKADVLAQVASLSGVPTPGGIIDRSITITPSNTTLPLLSANPARTWMLLYNPVVPQAQISMSVALWGVSTNFILGPGEALFWATAQNLGPVYQGAMTIIGLTTPLPFWAWEAN